MDRNLNRFVVIGSNSFSGAHFVDLLLERPEAEVIGISRSPEYPTCMLAYGHRTADRTNGRYTFVQADLIRSFDKIETLLNEIRPAYVINFAAQGEVGSSFNHPEDHYITNALGIVRLTDFLRQQDWLERYLHISTPEVYGSVDGGIKEDQRFDPSSPYAASKGSGDLFISSMIKTFDFPATTIRATNVFGAHQQLYRIIPRTIIYIKTGQKLQLHGGGKAIKSFIHIRDVSEGELLAITKGKAGETYHLSPDGDGVSVRHVVETVCTMMGERFEDHVEIAEDRTGQDKAYVIDSMKARSELGWKPSIPIENGIREMVDWIERDWDTIKGLPMNFEHKTS